MGEGSLLFHTVPDGRQRTLRLALDGAHPHGHFEGGLAFADEDAAGWGDVLVVATHRDAYVSPVGQASVGGIEADPAKAWQLAFGPMRGRPFPAPAGRPC